MKRENTSLQTFILNGWAAGPAAWELCTFPYQRIFSYAEQLDGEPEREMDNVSKVVLVGWSMGGSSALRLALRFPEKIAALLLVAATPRMMADFGWKGMSARRVEALERGTLLSGAGGLFPLPDGRPNPYLIDDIPTIRRGLDYLRETDLRADLLAARDAGSFSFPVTVFQSERDGIVRPENAHFLCEVFPQATVEWVSGAEHALPVHIPGRIDAAYATLVKLIQGDLKK